MCKCPLYRALRPWPFVKLDLIIALGIGMPLGHGIPQRHAHLWPMPAPRTSPYIRPHNFVDFLKIAMDVYKINFGQFTK
jgi:hypothetical protein